MALFKKKHSLKLIDADDLYKNVISKLPITNRISYCESLIYRSERDVCKSNCRIKKRKIKKLLQAAKIEIKKLKNTSV